MRTRDVAPWAIAAACLAVAGTMLAMRGQTAPSEAPAYMPAATPAPASMAAPPSERRSINITGQAERWVDPDRCRVFIGCETRQPTLKAARTENNQRVNRAMAAIRRLRLPGLKGKAPSLKVEIIYGKDRSDEMQLPPVLGYGVRQEFTVLLSGQDPMALSEGAGRVVDAALDGGANSVGDVIFFKENDVAVQRQLLGEAVKNALADAREMAKAAGGRVTKVSRLSSSPSYRYEAMAMQNAAGPGGPGGGATTTIVFGQVKVACAVSLDVQMQ